MYRDDALRLCFKWDASVARYPLIFSKFNKTSGCSAVGEQIKTTGCCFYRRECAETRSKARRVYRDDALRLCFKWDASVARYPLIFSKFNKTSGCSAVGSALALGACSQFLSIHFPKVRIPLKALTFSGVSHFKILSTKWFDHRFDHLRKNR